MIQEFQFGTCKLWQTTGKFGKLRRGAFFYKGKEGFGRGYYTQKAHWRKARVQGGDSFSLAEWWWFLIGWGGFWARRKLSSSCCSKSVIFFLLLLNVKLESIEVLKENIGKFLYDPRVGTIFSISQNLEAIKE